MRGAGLVIGLLLSSSVFAQQSASFKLTEHVINLGGDPRSGAVLASPSFRITLDAIGQGVGGSAMSGPTIRLRGGFVGPYRPPGEVLDLEFLTEQDLGWAGEAAAGHYNLYRDPVQLVSDHGTCYLSPINTTSATVGDIPAPGEIHFYLVTSVNPLHEEGTKGFESAGAERTNISPCP